MFATLCGLAVDFKSMLQRLQNRLEHKVPLLNARKQCCNVNAACLAEQFALKRKQQETRSCFHEKKILQKLVKSF